MEDIIICKEKNISTMSPEECADELAIIELEKLFKKARKKNNEADKALQEVYQAIEDMCIDLDIPSNAENANTLEEAINCYVQYGEYNLKGLLKEIKEQYVEK